MNDSLAFSGLLIATIDTPDLDRVVLEGCEVERQGDLLVARRKNAFLNNGLGIALDRLFGLGTPPAAISHIGVSSDNTAVTAATMTLGGTVSIKAISPAATRTNQTVTAGAVFTQADVAFAIRKVGLLSTSTDAGTGLVDVIGGSGGAAPYNQSLTIDLTATSSFSLTLQIQVTAAAA